jgi:hypothetical protein
MIDILIPVLGRPHRAAPLVQNIRDTTTEEHTITFLCSPDDAEETDACTNTGADVWTVGWDPRSADYSRKINHGFSLTTNEFVFMAADDLTFEPRWDTHALRAANSGPGYDVVGTNDLANAQVRRGQFGTHCLIRRRYVTEKGGTADGGPGTVLHEGYDHNFVDRELCHVAQHRGVFAFARHSHVKHSHPLWRTAPDDPTYRKALRHFRQDQRLFLSRAHLWNHVGLSAPERKMAA